MLPNDPGEQGWHVVLVVLLHEIATYEPILQVGQAEHDVDAGNSANEPSGQTIQAELTDALENDPGPHGTHFADDPPTEKYPGSQGRNPLANPMLNGPV